MRDVMCSLKCMFSGSLFDFGCNLLKLLYYKTKYVGTGIIVTILLKWKYEIKGKIIFNI